MKLTIDKNKLPEAPEMFLRRAGYTYIVDRRTGNESFARRLGRDFYPRFHLYLHDEGERVVFNLHLDQRRPVYPGTRAHSGEYEGEVVEEEVKRLKDLLGH